MVAKEERVFNALGLGDRARCEEEEEFTTELHGVRHGGAQSFFVHTFM